MPAAVSLVLLGGNAVPRTALPLPPSTSAATSAATAAAVSTPSPSAAAAAALAPSFLAFLLGAAATVAGTLAAFAVVGPSLGPAGHILAGALAASYVGGSVNYVATGHALGGATAPGGAALLAGGGRGGGKGRGGEGRLMSRLIIALCVCVTVAS